MLLSARNGSSKVSRRKAWLCRRPDASTLLLQGRRGRRFISQFRGDNRARGRQALTNLSLPHTAGGAGRHQRELELSSAEGLSGNDSRDEGFVRGLEQYQGGPGAVLPGRI